jgi:hypothetical protein
MLGPDEAALIESDDSDKVRRMLRVISCVVDRRWGVRVFEAGVYMHACVAIC